MIVTPRAADAEPEKCLADIRDDLIQRILPREPDRRSIFPDLPLQQHGRCDEKSRRRILPQRIADKLLADEAIVGRVVVKRADHVIAIRPRVRPLRVHLEAMRVRIAHDIEPMLRPAFAVARRCE